MIDKLKALKEKSRMTNQQIAEKSGVPESTVARIFSGKTPNPTITTVVSMARAMGGSAADFFNDDEGESIAAEFAAEDAAHHAESAGAEVPEACDGSSSGGASCEKDYRNLIEYYQTALRKKDEWIKKLFWCLFIIMLFLLLVFAYDLLNPNFGYVRY